MNDYDVKHIICMTFETFIFFNKVVSILMILAIFFFKNITTLKLCDILQLQSHVFLGTLKSCPSLSFATYFFLSNIIKYYL